MNVFFKCFSIVSIFLTVCIQIISGEQTPINIEDLQFNKEEVTKFLDTGKILFTENITLITEQKDVSANTPEFSVLIEQAIASIEKMKKTLNTTTPNTLEYKKVVNNIFHLIVFMIMHTYWNVLEINHDAYRYENGWNKKVTKELEASYAVDPKDYNGTSVSLYNKGKYSSLSTQDLISEELQILIKILQHQELKRHEQINTVRITYITWFFRIFGETEKTKELITKIHEQVAQLFRYHNKKHLLDSLIRFNM